MHSESEAVPERPLRNFVGDGWRGGGVMSVSYESQARPEYYDTCGNLACLVYMVRFLNSLMTLYGPGGKFRNGKPCVGLG